MTITQPYLIQRGRIEVLGLTVLEWVNTVPVLVTILWHATDQWVAEELHSREYYNATGVFWLHTSNPVTELVYINYALNVTCLNFWPIRCWFHALSRKRGRSKATARPPTTQFLKCSCYSERSSLPSLLSCSLESLSGERNRPWNRKLFFFPPKEVASFITAWEAVQT